MIFLVWSNDYFISLYSALSVGFQPPNYTINEGSTVSVCIEVLEGSIAVPITLMVEISEGTAEGNIKHIQRILVYIQLSLSQEMITILHSLLNLR